MHKDPTLVDRWNKVENHITGNQIAEVYLTNYVAVLTGEKKEDEKSEIHSETFRDKFEVPIHWIYL